MLKSSNENATKSCGKAYSPFNSPIIFEKVVN